MYDEDENTSNTQNPDEHTPVNNTPGVNGQPEDQNTPAPNNGEGGDQNGGNPPTNGEDDDDSDEDMSDQGSGVNFDNRQQ